MIYLNNSATSYPKPVSVIENIRKIIGALPADHSRSGSNCKSFDYITETRKLLSDFFSVKNPEQVIFTSGATESLNLAIKGTIKEGDHVITTEAEHNSILRPLKTLERNEIIDLSIVKCDEYGFVKTADIINKIKPNTKLIAINHASNVTGTIQDIKSISELISVTNIKLLVDASQTAGNIPINFTDLDIDYLAFTGHKYMYGLQGAGCLIIKDGNKPEPLKTGGTGTKSNLLYQPDEMPLLYEAGTPNITGIASLYEGAKYIIDTGFEQIEKTKRELINKIISDTEKNRNIQIIGFNKNINQLPVLNFRIKEFSIEDVNYILENSYNISTRAGLHCAPLIHKRLGTEEEGTIRVSPSVFNTISEIEILCNAINKIAETT